MQLQREKILPVLIEEEMKESYIDYAMSVIVARALPDVRDGLKPVQRRILYGMSDLALRPGSPYKKCARIVGEVLGKYHPHGDMAVYDALVRMAQEFTLRYPLVDGQGNFGSIDADAPAAMRYTEARLAPIAEELLRDIEKNTVAFVPNFDESLKEPSVLPALLPNLLVNGGSGIAVGMATNIPPHNLGEVIDALVALIDKPDLPIRKLMELIHGPDFPTGAIIYGDEGIDEAYRTGRGRITVRARATIETHKSGRESIVVTEIPYQVNKAGLIEKIAELVRDKRIEGIGDLRDESDREGLRIVIELRRDVEPQIVLNQLYKLTPMQTTFGVIMLALVNGEPKVLNLKQLLQHFIDFRHEVVVRRTQFDLEQAEKRAHLLEGLKVCIDHIDEIVALIKKSKDPDTAKANLMKGFELSEVQAQAILDMRLQRLTGLEREKIEKDYRDTLKLIEQLRSLLKSKPKRMELIKTELVALKEKYADRRRTEIIAQTSEFSVEDVIAEEDMVITITHDGFIKRTPVSGYRRQGRGSQGVSGAATRDEDFVQHFFIASTHDYILLFTNRGRCYWQKVHEIPQGGRGSKGRAIVNLVNLAKDERVAAYINVRDFDDEHFVVMVTKQGIVKKTALANFSNPRKAGLNAISIREGDALIDAKLTDGTQDILIGTRNGKAIRFQESEVRDMGRTAAGVKGIELEPGDAVIGVVAVKREGTLLVVTERGYGKRSDIREYRLTGRGGKGMITFKTSEKSGKLVAMMEVLDDDDLMVISAKGMTLRQHVKDISIRGRNTQGVRLIKLKGDDVIADVARVMKSEEEANAEA